MQNTSSDAAAQALANMFLGIRQGEGSEPRVQGIGFRSEGSAQGYSEPLENRSGMRHQQLRGTTICAGCTFVPETATCLGNAGYVLISARTLSMALSQSL